MSKRNYLKGLDQYIKSSPHCPTEYYTAIKNGSLGFPWWWTSLVIAFQ